MGINRYPLWKNLLIIFIVALGFIYALPNLFGEDPGIQVSAKNNGLPNSVKESIINTLKENQVSYKKIINDNQGNEWISLNHASDQLKLRDKLKALLGNQYIVALNLVPAAPAWLQALGGAPMKLGLDLRGGVHFLMQVDLQSVLKTRYTSLVKDIKSNLRGDRIRYRKIYLDKKGGLSILFKNEAELEAGQTLIQKKSNTPYVFKTKNNNVLNIQYSLAEQKTINTEAMEQTMTTLRNRVNELGVAEALVQQQGANRVVVELPGIQDVAAAKEIIGKTATLQFLLVNTEADPNSAEDDLPAGSKIIKNSAGRPYVFKQDIILSGDQVVRAKSNSDQYGKPSVDISVGGDTANFTRTTAQNIGKPMGTIYIETTYDTHMVNGKKKQVKKTTETAINVATIQSALPNRFQVTGLSSPKEAYQLALLLRAGALPAPMNIVEERTIGPSLGADNIQMGVNSVIGGLSVVLLFMVIYYGWFGVIADIALVFNLMLLVATMSLLGATLTLPGIAGIVLTLGMAVDANVLIFERIREEINRGNSPQACIHSGFEKAFTTIMDANITTFIAALVLFTLGSGPIKGFAVTLTLGLVTSVFTAIMITRSIINYCYGGRKLEKIAIGI